MLGTWECPHQFHKFSSIGPIKCHWAYPLVILAVLFKARHAVKAAKGMALASCKTPK